MFPPTIPRVISLQDTGAGVQADSAPRIDATRRCPQARTLGGPQLDYFVGGSVCSGACTLMIRS